MRDRGKCSTSPVQTPNEFPRAQPAHCMTVLAQALQAARTRGARLALCEYQRGEGEQAWRRAWTVPRQREAARRQGPRGNHRTVFVRASDRTMATREARAQDVREAMRSIVSILLAESEKSSPPRRAAALPIQAADSGAVRPFLRSAIPSERSRRRNGHEPRWRENASLSRSASPRHLPHCSGTSSSTTARARGGSGGFGSRYRTPTIQPLLLMSVRKRISFRRLGT